MAVAAQRALKQSFTGSRPGVGVGVCEVLDAFLPAGGSLLRDFVAHWDSDIRWFGLQRREHSDRELRTSLLGLVNATSNTPEEEGLI